MSTNDDRTPSSSPPQLTDLDAKLDRIAGLCAHSVTQQDRLARLYAANAQLDARSKREQLDLLTESRAVLAQVRDALSGLGAEGASYVRRRREDDSKISASLNLQIRGDEEESGGASGGKTSTRKLILAVAKTIGIGVAVELGHRLIGK